ncbi:MAG: hypothetical protein M1814_004728 [Vezdaea aestivalis]|nr:MAG: hypothetical protein M1814_004728 [Vezdaea aestivalis]
MAFDGKCLPVNDPDALWPYCPSLVLAIIFAILFGFSTVIHIYQAVHYRKTFCWVIGMGALWETLAFVFRSLSTRDQTNDSLYRAQFLLILVAPLWINAFDYMLLGRMIHFYLPEQKVLGVRPRRLTLWFVLLDITAFLVQIFGGLLASTTSGDEINSRVRLGGRIYTGGVALQQALILFFLCLAIAFHRRVRKESVVVRETSWKILLYVLYASLTLISLRVIFRIVEFSNLDNPTLAKHEVYTYVLDAMPMFLAAALFNIYHPGRVLVGPESEFPKYTRAEKRVMKTEQKARKAEKKAMKAANKKNGNMGQEMPNLHYQERQDNNILPM